MKSCLGPMASLLLVLPGCGGSLSGQPLASDSVDAATSLPDAVADVESRPVDAASSRNYVAPTSVDTTGTTVDARADAPSSLLAAESASTEADRTQTRGRPVRTRRPSLLFRRRPPAPSRISVTPGICSSPYPHLATRARLRIRQTPLDRMRVSRWTFRPPNWRSAPTRSTAIASG
jgi:hypothetical protein